MYWLEAGALSQTERNIVYLCRPEVRRMRIIAGESSCLPSRSSSGELLSPDTISPVLLALYG